VVNPEKKNIEFSVGVCKFPQANYPTVPAQPDLTVEVRQNALSPAVLDLA